MELAYAPPFSSAKDPVNMAGYVAQNILEGVMTPFYAEDVAGIPADAIRLDVRKPQELEDLGTLPGFINIPVDELRSRMGELDLSRPIYVSCQVGLRGNVAARMLQHYGARVYNLSGGYTLYSAYAKDQEGLADDANKNCTACGMQEKR